jgi:hypothetical protein
MNGWMDEGHGQLAQSEEYKKDTNKQAADRCDVTG